MADVGDSSSPDTDRDFEPAAELLVHERDDEGTLEEEENMSTDSGDNDELDDLQKEGDMPLEDLLAMYGYGADSTSGCDQQESHGSTSEEEILNNHDLTLDKEEVARDILKNDDGSETSLEDLIDNVHTNTTLSLLNGSAGDDIDEEDEDYLPVLEEEFWKKNIQVGDEYQAIVPDFVGDHHSADADTAEERLVWDPNILEESEVEGFLRNVQANKLQLRTEGQELVTDDEQALYLLLQSGFNVDEAVRRRQLQTTPCTDPLSLWSEEECQNFESGLRVHGKNFFAIHQNKVRTRSVGELVQFYYFWKKTERREAFCNRGRIEKKKMCVNPGITDYMDRFGEKSEIEVDSTVALPVDCSCEVSSSTTADIESSDGGKVVERTDSTNFVEGKKLMTQDDEVPTKISDSDQISTNVSVSLKRNASGLPITTSFVQDDEVTSKEQSKRIRVDQISFHPSVTAEVGN